MIKTSLPVIVLKNIILFPHSEIRLELESDKDKELLSLAESYYDKHILIVHQTDLLETNFDITNLSKIGIIGYISMKIDLPNNKTRVVIRGINRVMIDGLQQEDSIVVADIKQTEAPELEELEQMAYARALKKQVEYYIDNNPNTDNSILSTINNMNDLSKLTDIVCMSIPESYERKLEILEEIDPTVRVTMLLEDINQELKIVGLEKLLEEKVGKSLEKSQKDYLLQEKLKAIKEELGISYDKEDETITLRSQIENLKCNKKVKDCLYLELNRYETSPIASPELGIIRNYIDWLLKLPWQKSTIDNKDLKKASKSLDKTHYGLEEVKTRIIEYLALQQLTKNENSPIICLVGPPGVGKTSLAKSIAAAMNRNYTKISVGGINDEAEIVGHRRTYLGSAPGRIIQGLKKAGSNNPVFVIDEIDKMCKDIKGDPASSLLEVLDKEQNHSFSDHYIEQEFDLSKVMFICTANYEEQIPLELLDRLEIINISSYTEYEKLKIAKFYVIPKSIISHGLTKEQVKFSDDAILKIIRSYTKEAGIRDLERQINSILRKIVTEIVVDNSKKTYSIKEKEVLKYLKKEKYIDPKNNYFSRVGVVNAMSYTLFGGDILPIEVSYYNGNGSIIVTGSLGDVFKESTSIALSYIKSNAKSLKIDSDLLTKNDIHIHVPEGAVKKEGPSAGIAIITAIISALKGIEIDSSISMTGEITLRGNILPIGGLKEKVIGAKRNGIKKIFIPKENERDLDEIEDQIKENIEFILVSNYDEIIKSLKL